MKRSSSPSGFILLVVCLLLAGLFLHRVLRVSPSHRPPAVRSAPMHGYEGRRYRERERYPRERGSQYGNHATDHSPHTSGSCSALGVTCSSEYFADWTEP